LDVQSVVLESFEYDYPTQQLTYRMTSGRRGRFYQVPSGTWRALRRAAAAGASVGGYFNRNIRNTYRHRALKPTA